MAGTKQDAARPGRATGLKKQKSKSPKTPAKETNNTSRFSFGKKSANPDASPSNKGLKKKQSLPPRSRATSPTKTATKAQAKPKSMVKTKPKPMIKAARGNPFGSGASSSSSSVGSFSDEGVVPLSSPRSGANKKTNNVASPKAASPTHTPTHRSRHVQIRTEASPIKSKTTRECDIVSVTSSNLGVVPILTTTTSPSHQPVREEGAKKKANQGKKSKANAKEKTTAASMVPTKIEDDDRSDHSEKSFAQSITETILPYLVKRSKTQDNCTSDAEYEDKEKSLEKETTKVEEPEEANPTNNYTSSTNKEDCRDDDCAKIDNNGIEGSKETDIEQDNVQGEQHHHRRVHAAFRGATSSQPVDESRLAVEDSAFAATRTTDTNLHLLDNIKRIETPTNAATLDKVVTALLTERENAVEARGQLREALAELDGVKRDFRDAKEAYSCENFRLNNKLTRMMDRIEQLEHEMTMNGKNFVVASYEGETSEYNSTASPSTRYGARSPRAVRLSKIPWACVDSSSFVFINPCGGISQCGGGGGTEEGGGGGTEDGDYFSRPSNSLVVKE